jgi:hypothetical protein
MSEYQYYEFLALDRALTQHDIRELRKYSTRATITATRFVNHYEWVESRCGAVAVGPSQLLPPLSSGGVAIDEPWLRFHIPLIEPDGPY